MKENKHEPCFNNDTSAKVESLFKLVTEFSFNAALVITRNILHYFLLLSKKLQAKDSDIAQIFITLTVMVLRGS